MSPETLLKDKGWRDILLEVGVARETIECYDYDVTALGLGLLLDILGRSHDSHLVMRGCTAISLLQGREVGGAKGNASLGVPHCIINSVHSQTLEVPFLSHVLTIKIHVLLSSGSGTRSR